MLPAAGEGSGEATKSWFRFRLGSLLLDAACIVVMVVVIALQVFHLPGRKTVWMDFRNRAIPVAIPHIPC